MNYSSTLSAKCVVPWCKNTTTNCRNKVFVSVKESLKRKWCQELNIMYQPGRRMLCCEDHLNLEEDLENYQYWKVMKGRTVLKSTAQLRLRRDLPSCSRDVPETSTFETPELKSLLLRPVENLAIGTSSTEVHTAKLKTHFEDADNYITDTRPTVLSASTHPIKIDVAIQCGVEMFNKSTSTKDLTQMTKTTLPLSSSTSSASICEVTLSPSLYGCTSDTETTVTQGTQERLSSRMQILQFISNDPKAYIGIPKQYFWLINHIVKQSKTKVTDIDIIITLFKIKLNDPVSRICDHFQVSRVTFSQSLNNGIEVLASFFQNLIYMPTLLQIKQNQPLAFKIRYSNVQLLLDAFEIEIQKPHNPVCQAQTWSQYKNANTVKYLVGSTPNGFVSYISKGYGGRISDKALVEKSDLIDCLPQNAVIMADRGFKDVEALLNTKGIKLLRPPSVYASSKPTKEEVIQTKVVASLRVHIERVIRRIREFRFLKPHSVVSHKHIGYLDYVVVIACGLINLQNEIIKRE